MLPNKILALTVWLLVSSQLSAAPTAETLPEEMSSVVSSRTLGAVTMALIVGGLLLTAFTLWFRKQDQINNMVYFCLDYLINARNKTERERAARELGRTNNPQALLVLIGVVNDESADVGLREAARDALLDMGKHYRGFKKAIIGFLAAAENNDHARTVELLKTHFEHEGKQYVQSAYIIGRELVKAKEYADAREWLRTAANRNKRLHMYMDHIRDLTNRCNQHLFAEGDIAFKVGDFDQANEHFALAAHGLSTEVSNRFAYYLRAACVYIKLEEYEKASEALLQALHHQQETDIVLELKKLVSKVLHLVGDSPQAKEKQQNVSRELDRVVNQIMDSLSARDSQSQ